MVRSVSILVTIGCIPRRINFTEVFSVILFYTSQSEYWLAAVFHSALKNRIDACIETNSIICCIKRRIPVTGLFLTEKLPRSDNPHMHGSRNTKCSTTVIFGSLLTFFYLSSEKKSGKGKQKFI